jgi:hypothetical protein
MAILTQVPGRLPMNGDDPYGGLPKELRPTQADFHITAAMMAQNGAFDPPAGQPPVRRLAFDTSGMRPSTNVEDVRGRGPATPPPALDLIMQDPLRSQRFLPRELRKPLRAPGPTYLAPGDFPDVG